MRGPVAELCLLDIKTRRPATTGIFSDIAIFIKKAFKKMKMFFFSKKNTLDHIFWFFQLQKFPDFLSNKPHN